MKRASALHADGVPYTMGLVLTQPICPTPFTCPQVPLYHSIINKDLVEVLLFRANVQIVPVGKVLVPSELQTLTKDLDVAVKCGTFPNLVQVVGSLLAKD